MGHAISSLRQRGTDQDTTWQHSATRSVILTDKLSVGAAQSWSSLANLEVAGRRRFMLRFKPTCRIDGLELCCC
jgi:hypothetical protein